MASLLSSTLQALEPYVSEEIMKLHHQKHHQTYVNGLNAAEEAYAKTSTPKDQIALQPALKFNGGGKFRLFLRSYRQLMDLCRPHQPLPFLEESRPSQW